jgi:uncharacterized protein (DUF2235 family)
MKKIIICADGTWNTENQTDNGTPCPTNVVKIARILMPRDSKGIDQVVYYHPGVGTNIGQRIGGGAFGAGLFANVRDCYRFLMLNYAPGDLIYLFGFSRGAYTVRSLAGLIRNSGILRRGHEAAEARAIENYRDYSDATAPDSAAMRAFRTEHAYTENGNTDQEIELIGVWDTVGALGIPGIDSRFRLPGGLDWQFHDVKLSSYVKNAFHALAIHEHRTEFLPTLWEQSEAGRARKQRLEQVWFVGVHSDVGGGYAESGLSDIPLLWMIKCAAEAGLEFGQDALQEIKDDVLADAHDSFTTLYKIINAIGMHPGGSWRTIGPVGAEPDFSFVPNRYEAIHQSAVARFHHEPKVMPHHWPDAFERVVAKMKRAVN